MHRNPSWITSKGWTHFIPRQVMLMSDHTSRQAFGLKILNARHKEIRRLKREGYIAEIHGNKFWNSSFLIMDYLRQHPIPSSKRVLEIGCGWGLLGLFCSKKFSCSVHGIDADENVIPYLDLHAKVNKTKMTAEKKKFEQLSIAYLSQFDVILGADICFWNEMTEALLKLINRAKRGGVSTIMIADPCRSPFTDLAEKAKERYKDVSVVEKFLKKPVNATGEILIIDT